jgi:GNAT superfamily N-acetyltransferase
MSSETRPGPLENGSPRTERRHGVSILRLHFSARLGLLLDRLFFAFQCAKALGKDRCEILPYQLYISSAARGSGLAAPLILDAEARLRKDGVRRAWLACAIGNVLPYIKESLDLGVASWNWFPSDPNSESKCGASA